MTARISTADPLRERLYWHGFALEPKDAGWSLYDLVRGEPWPFAAARWPTSSTWRTSSRAARRRSMRYALDADGRRLEAPRWPHRRP
jgi:hypothetical protein